MTERRCVDCVHYCRTGAQIVGKQWQHAWFCLADGPRTPCPDYQREPGADDDKESGQS
jgi:hypothetical protein